MLWSRRLTPTPGSAPRSISTRGGAEFSCGRIAPEESLTGSGLDRRKENGSSLDMSATEDSSSWHLHGFQVASFLLNYQFNSACFWQSTLPLDTAIRITTTTTGCSEKKMQTSHLLLTPLFPPFFSFRSI